MVNPPVTDNRGFTLVEMSIVLVIIGLLIGAILGGESMVKAGKVRSIVTELEGYKSAALAFKSEYGGWPGDITNAYAAPSGGSNTSKLWSFIAGNFCGNTALRGCEGNKNDLIDGLPASWNQETLRAWHQLSLAKMITGSYTGCAAGSSACSVRNTNNALAVIPGRNVPVSKFSEGTGFQILYTLNASEGRVRDGNAIFFGRQSLQAPRYLSDGALTPSDNLSLDQKMDDGFPLSGNLWAMGAGINNAPNCYDRNATNFPFNIADKREICRPIYWLEESRGWNLGNIP